MKSAAWRMHWQKSGNDDAGGEKSPPFPAGPRKEQKDVAAGSACGCTTTAVAQG